MEVGLKSTHPLLQILQKNIPADQGLNVVGEGSIFLSCRNVGPGLELPIQAKASEDLGALVGG